METRMLRVAVSMGVLVLLLASTVSAFSVGTAPGVYNLGTLTPGTKKTFTFYLLTNSKRDLIVSLSYISPHRDLLSKTKIGGYTFVPESASEYDISDWVSFKQNSVLVSPTNVKVVKLGDTVIRANGEATVTISVPRDAEPCYYVGSINLNPQFRVNAPGTGVQTIGLTRFVFLFNVDGNGKRGGEVTDIVADREGSNRVRIDHIFKNTGQCTMGVRIPSSIVYDKTGEVNVTLRTGVHIVAPGETKIIPVYWINRPQAGRFNVETTLSYISGSIYKQAEINVPKMITYNPSPVSVFKNAIGAKGCTFPWWVVLIVLIAAVLTYLLNQRSSLPMLLVILAVLIFIFGLLSCNIIPLWMLLVVIIIIVSIIYWKS